MECKMECVNCFEIVQVKEYNNVRRNTQLLLEALNLYFKVFSPFAKHLNGLLYFAYH